VGRCCQFECQRLQSNAILRWPTDARIDTAVIDAGKPWQNGTNESFNGKFRDECLSVKCFAPAAKLSASSKPRVSISMRATGPFPAVTGAKKRTQVTEAAF
jgi:Integrase core domain